MPRASSFKDALRERECPRCHAVAVRTYGYPSYRRASPSLIAYSWCHNCHRFAGTTGPLPSGFRFSDPLGNLSDDERLEFYDRLGPGMAFLGHLDSLWDKGKLPQRPLSP